MRMLLVAMVAVILGGCAAQQVPTAPQPGGAIAPLPGRVVWTDGHGAVNLAAAGAANCPATARGDAAAALSATNAVRAQHGLAPLRTNPVLQRVAELHACDMAARGAMTHEGSTTKGPMARAKQQGYRPRLIAENIAAGRFGLDRTLAEWSASPGHRANILIGQVSEFGIGHALASDGKTVFWASVYAAPR
ncbi:CAP domain-containing protein [Paenirhodobacter sp.]|uniref:CAP domain-containing protein n=1 Tax=Paenirhodobacter sp. TaxID=1965326 RepID=UPI003B3CCDF3